jgi:hypothetical protein
MRPLPILAAPLLCSALLACASASPPPAPPAPPTARYRPVGPTPAVGGPLLTQPVGGGVAEYSLERADVIEPGVVVVRTIRADGTAPVRVDLGRLRLHAAQDDLPLLRVCVLDGEPDCLDHASARGQVRTVDPGSPLRIQADFGQLPPPVAGDPVPDLSRLTLVDNGIVVGGRQTPVAISLERVGSP